MLSTGQMLAAIRTLEIKVGSTLYQARRELDVTKSLGMTLQALSDVQKELERLGEN